MTSLRPTPPCWLPRTSLLAARSSASLLCTSRSVLPAVRFLQLFNAYYRSNLTRYRQRHQDPRPWRPVRPPRPRPLRHENRPHRGRYSHSLRLHPSEGRSPWSPFVETCVASLLSCRPLRACVAGLEAAKLGVLPVNMDGINAKNGLFAWSSIFSYPKLKMFLFGCVVVCLGYMNQ